MKISYLIILLLALTLGMQSVILYRDFVDSSGDAQPPIVPAPKSASLELAGLPVQGVETARVIVVEFSDYECPYCARHAAGVGKELLKEFVDTGKVRHAFANNPLSSHTRAKFLATAAICAGKQNQYWQMYDVLFKWKPKNESDLQLVTDTVELDRAKFEECLKRDSEPSKIIERDLKQANEFRFAGTPAFAIGSIRPDGRIAVQSFIIGARPIEVFREAINSVLSQSTVTFGGPQPSAKTGP